MEEAGLWTRVDSRAGKKGRNCPQLKSNLSLRQGWRAPGGSGRAPDEKPICSEMSRGSAVSIAAACDKAAPSFQACYKDSGEASFCT